MKQIALSEIKDDLSRYLRLSEKEEIIITKHGKPAGVLMGFASEDDWFDYRLEHDVRFLSGSPEPARACRGQRDQAGRVVNEAEIGSPTNPALEVNRQRRARADGVMP